MTLECVPYRAAHLMAMALQPAQAWMYPLVGPQEAKALEGPWSWAGVAGGDVVACGGVLQYWKNRGMAWAFLSERAGKHMVAMTRTVHRLLDDVPCARVEAAVECDFKAGHRWARLLGFELETERARKYLENGADCSIYVRVR